MIQKDFYIVPGSVIHKVIPDLIENPEAALLYVCLYCGFTPDISQERLKGNMDYLRSKNVLETIPDGVKLYSDLIVDMGTVKVVDFVEEAKKKAEAKVKSYEEKEVVNADSLIALFNSLYLEIKGYPYKEQVTMAEKGMMKNLIKEYGPERANTIVKNAVRHWGTYGRDNLTIANMYARRENIPSFAGGFK